MEVLPSEFNYFTPSAVQAAITDEYDESFDPTSGISTTGPIQFAITGMPNVYRDLSNSYLSITCKVTNADGTALAADAAVAPANLFLHTMFSGFDVTLCGTAINENNTTYHYRAFFEQLLTYPAEVLHSRSKVAGWQLDENPALLDAVILADAGGAQANPAFVARNKLIKASREVTLVGRPHADIFHQNLDIPPSCPILLKLTRNADPFVLMAAADATFKVTITAAKMFIRSKVVAPELILAHRDMLNHTNFRLPLTKVKIDAYQIATGSSSAEFTDLFKTKLPKRIVVGLIAHARTSGAYNKNPFKFDNMSATQVAVTVGGSTIPRDPLVMNYGAHSYGRAYLNTLAALGYDIGDRSIVVNPNLWAFAYTLYAFKLVPGLCDQTESVRNLSNVKIKFTFGTALTEPVDVLIYSETNGALEITNLNSVVMS
jgi:hypothetical protein